MFPSTYRDELVFKHDRITLFGQTIFYYSRSKQTTRILEALNVKTQTGTWIAKSGPELIHELGSASGQNSITCLIRAFRDSASDLLKTQLGLICGKQDIISSGGRGYRFNDWITIRDTRKAETDPIEIEDTPASRRQRILELLGDGGKQRSTCIANHLGCSLKTVKRVMGKGIALEFKKRFPDNFIAYKTACDAGQQELEAGLSGCKIYKFIVLSQESLTRVLKVPIMGTLRLTP